MGKEGGGPISTTRSMPLDYFGLTQSAYNVLIGIEAYKRFVILRKDTRVFLTHTRRKYS